MSDVIEEEEEHSHPYLPFGVERRCVFRVITGDTPR